ncbi:hypothetical protein [Shinella zoogloeoides]|uniref:hypothetical protein n=1 Tax=Shinella zoogloeoides TaxID=352475 RepID=UPI0028B05DEF|nr:hypothetical protein [Shinella zoogloeoides]
MTDHSIEELERQVAQATTKKEVADRELREAKARLHGKRVADSGLVGKYAKSRGRTLLIKNLQFYEFFGGRPSLRCYDGPRILKDGSEGQQISIYASDGVEISDTARKAGEA